MADFDRRATRLIAVSFAALAVYVGVESVRHLVAGTQPEASAVGIVLAALSLVVMPVLARAKRRLAPVLGSQPPPPRQTKPACVPFSRQSSSAVSA